MIEKLRDRRLQPLAGQRLAVDHEPAPAFGAPRSRSRAAAIPASAAACARLIPASSAPVFTRRRRRRTRGPASARCPRRAACRRARAGTRRHDRLARRRGPHRAQRDLVADLVVATCHSRRSSSRPNSSSGCSSKPPSPRAAGLHRADDEWRSPRARRTGTGRAEPAGPRGAAPASGRVGVDEDVGHDCGTLTTPL